MIDWASISSAVGISTPFDTLMLEGAQHTSLAAIWLLVHKNINVVGGTLMAAPRQHGEGSRAYLSDG